MEEKQQPIKFQSVGIVIFKLHGLAQLLQDLNDYERLLLQKHLQSVIDAWAENSKRREE